MNLLPAFLVPLLCLAPVFDGWLGVYLDTESDTAVVAEVIPDSPAAKGGLQAGDVLLAVNEKATPTPEDFVAAIRAQNAGDRVRLKVSRGGKEETLVVKLAERAEEGTPAPKPTKPTGSEKTEKTEKTGKIERSGDKADKKPAAAAQPSIETKPKARAGGKSPYLGLSLRENDEAVVVDRIVDGGPAAKSSLAAGDQITSIDDQPVANLGDIDGILRGLAPGQKIAIGVRGKGGVRSVTLSVGEREAEAKEATPRSELRPRSVAAPQPEAKVKEQPKKTAEKVAEKAPETKVQEKGKDAGDRDVDAEIDALRKELKELRKQLEDLKKQGSGG